MRQIEMLVDKAGADAKQVADNDKIIEIARVAARAKSEDDCGELVAELTELQRLDGPGSLLVGIALKVLLGKRCCFASANPETIKRCHSLASDLSATVRDEADDLFLKQNGFAGMTLLLFSPPPSAQLQQMLQEMKTIAEGCFRRDGAVVPRFFLEFETGEFVEIVCPWGSRDEKKQALAAIKQRIREQGPLLRYCHVAEVWVSSDHDVTPSKSPNRTERLMIIAVERAAPIGGTFEIKRHALSAKPTLGEWSDYSGMQNSPHFDLFDDDDPAADGRTLQ
jgi:hypothetical protein